MKYKGACVMSVMSESKHGVLTDPPLIPTPPSGSVCYFSLDLEGTGQEHQQKVERKDVGVGFQDQ